MDSNLISALIGAGVSLLVLLLSIFWERIKTRNEVKTQRKKKLIYVAALIKPIIVYSKRQVENIKRFSLAIQNNPLEFPLLVFDPKSDLEKFKQMDEEEFFDAFSNFYHPYHKSVKVFKNISSIINYQNLQMEQVLEIIKNSQALDHERKLKYKNSLKSATDMAADALANDAMQQHLPLIKLLDSSLVQYLSNRESASDIKYSHDAFVQPVLNGILENQFYTFPLGRQIATHLHEAVEVYNEIQLQLAALKNDMDHIAENYEDSNDKLKIYSNPLLKDFFENARRIKLKELTPLKE